VCFLRAELIGGASPSDTFVSRLIGANQETQRFYEYLALLMSMPIIVLKTAHGFRDEVVSKL
jgi:hypothetical protein